MSNAPHFGHQKFILVGILCASLLGCKEKTNYNGGINAGEPYKGMQGILEPLKSQYKTGESINFRLKLKNVGNETIYLPDKNWNRDANSGNIYVAWPADAGGFKSGVKFPLLGWEKIEPGQEVSCLIASGRPSKAASGVKFRAEVEILAPSPDYKGWTGLIYSPEVPVDFIGPDTEEQDKSSDLSWNDPNTCVYLHMNGAPGS